MKDETKETYPANLSLFSDGDRKWWTCIMPVPDFVQICLKTNDVKHYG